MCRQKWATLLIFNVFYKNRILVIVETETYMSKVVENQSLKFFPFIIKKNKKFKFLIYQTQILIVLDK